MSKLNLLVNLNTYSDSYPSNNPNRSNFKWTRALNSFPVMNAQSQALTIAPGQTIPLFSGTRTISQDGTTQYSIAPVLSSSTMYTLTAVGGTLPNFRTPRTTGADATSALDVTVNGPLATFSSAPDTYASFSGCITGMLTNITITANNIGTVGNSVSLTFDGTTSINTEITAWNIANPSNTVTLTTGDGTQIPSSGGVIDLTGGTSPTPLNLISGGMTVGDNVIIGNNFNPSNQGQFIVLAVTATSFTIENPTSVNEGPINLGSGFATQLQIFSSGPVQPGDTLVISGGFSLVTQGTYEITQVAANYLTFSSVNILPTEGPITTDDIVIYSDAKSLIYVECDQPCSLIINGVTTDAIEPFITSCYQGPGIFLRKSTIYSLSVLNPGIQPANLFFASCE